MSPRGLMDKASDFESEDCRFESCRGRLIFVILRAILRSSGLGTPITRMAPSFDFAVDNWEKVILCRLSAIRGAFWSSRG